MGKTQENGVTPQNDPNHYLKYHFQLKIKDVCCGVENQLWQVFRQSPINKGTVVMQI